MLLTPLHISIYTSTVTQVCIAIKNVTNSLSLVSVFCMAVHSVSLEIYKECTATVTVLTTTMVGYILIHVPFGSLHYACMNVCH